MLLQTGVGKVPSEDLESKGGGLKALILFTKFLAHHSLKIWVIISAMFSPIIACMQLRTNTGKKPWYEAVPVQSMMLESLGVLSRWTIEVKVRKEAALIS